MYLKLIIPTFFILLSIVVLSCEYKSTIGNPEENLAVEAGNNDSSLEINDELEEDENDPHEPEITFPKTGNKASDFLPKLGIYKIQYQAKGDLNKDGKVDIVLVLVHKDVKTEERPMLILLQNKDKSYRLDKISQIAFPIEYNDYDSKLFDTEDIAIDKGELNINLYSIGPSGNAFGKLIIEDYL